jgi:hypothetical protein
MECETWKVVSDEGEINYLIELACECTDIGATPGKTIGMVG